MDDKTFLKKLKAGDQVIVVMNEEKLLREVSKITRFGYIRINGVNFNPITGKMCTNKSYCALHLEEATPEALEEFKKQNT